jgi:peptide/nickel transport system permease protein
MATVFEKKQRFDELKLSARVFFANKSAVAGLVIFVGFLVVGLLMQLAPWILGVQNAGLAADPSCSPACVGLLPTPPSSANWFGTTQVNGIGNVDLLSLMMKAVRVDLALSFFIVLSGAAIGTILGVVSGYAGGLVDEALMRVTDIFFTIPFLVLALAVGFVIGRTLENMALSLVVVWWPLYARYGRSLTLSTKEMTFIEAARAAGSGRLKILFRHITPNVLPPIFIQISLDVGTILGIFASLAFIGFLPSTANVPELGYIANQGLTWGLLGRWWTVVFPGGAITLFALAVNLMGDGFRDVIDPRRRS